MIFLFINKAVIKIFVYKSLSAFLIIPTEKPKSWTSRSEFEHCKFLDNIC